MANTTQVTSVTRAGDPWIEMHSSHPPQWVRGQPVFRTYCVGAGPTEIGFTGAGAAGAVNPGITGAVVTTPVAASVMLIPYASSVLDVNWRSAARSFAYAAVAEISVFSAFAWFLCCCRSEEHTSELQSLR